MIFAVAFPWIVSSLIANLQLLAIGKESSSPPAQPVEEHNSPLQMGIAQYNSSLEVGNIELVAIVASAIITLFLVWKLRRRARRQDWYAYENLTTTHPFAFVIALGLIVLIFYGLITLVRILPNSIPPNLAPSHMDASRFLVPLAVGVIISSSVLGLFLFFREYRSSQPCPNPLGTKVSEEVQRFAYILDHTIYSLRSGMDYRTTIIDCYRALCKVLERCGVPNSSSLTPREFETLSLSKLNISSRYLREATLLFEKARYSDEPVSKEEATRSTESLERLRAEVASSVKLAEEMVVVNS
jgi:hypothetical protein